MIAIDTFLERLDIAGHPGLRVSRKVEGYRDYTFGCRAGPSRASVRNLAHELAHAAEFGAGNFSKRCFMGSFVFKVRKVKVMGQLYPEPRTCNATKRELRTFALQLHLLQHAGEKIDVAAFVREAAQAMTRFMYDWHIIPGAEGEDRLAWCEMQIRKHYKKTSPHGAISEIKGWLDATQLRLKRSSVPQVER